MGRQLVHLSTDVPTALQVARRKGAPPVILVVDAQTAADAGIPFYEGNPETWLADEVPARFLSGLRE
jgi:putative RNA 2'-phosphotransferase